MATIELHPSELAYAFSYARTGEIIGWGAEPFAPSGPGAGDPADWYAQGEGRMVEAGHLLGTPETGLNFTDEVTAAILALVNPGVVLLAQRKADDGGVQTMTVHVRGSDHFGLIQRTDGMFELTRYDGMTAAVVGCAVFVGADLAPIEAEDRIATDADRLQRLKDLAGRGQTDRLAEELARLGAPAPAAASAARALAAPAATGVVSVLYCAANTVEDAEAFTVMTSAEDQTWLLFFPEGPGGPVYLERCSVSALTARITVGIAIRFSDAA